MSVVISGIEKHSPAAKADIHPGDRLVSINGNEIIDVLDYRFYMMEKKLSESENPSTRLKRGCGFIVSYPDLVTAKDVSLCIHVPVDAIERTVEDIEKCPFDTTYLGEKR